MVLETTRIVTICSSIPRLASTVQNICNPQKMTVVTVDPASINKDICDQTDFLIAEHKYLEPLLFLQNHGRLKFVQNTWAGVDSLIKVVKEKKLEPNLKLARLSHPKFSQLMAEYSLAAVINMERNFYKMAMNQLDKSWNTSGLTEYRCLADLKVGVLGVGQIGKTVAKTFAALGCDVFGYVNTPRTSSSESFITKFYVGDDLQLMMSHVDYIINVLPSTESTNNLLNRKTLQHCKNIGFVNIGRGNVISEEDILFALNEGMFKKVVLDVFKEEPLPQSSPLWSHPDVTVTPHVAGESQPQDIAECFLRNLERFDQGLEPDCLVKWDQSY